MADKSKYRVDGALRPHIPRLENVYTANQVKNLILGTGLKQSYSISDEEIGERLRHSAQARLLAAMDQNQPHRDRLLARLKSAECGLNQAIDEFSDSNNQVNLIGWLENYLPDRGDTQPDGWDDPIAHSVSEVTRLADYIRLSIKSIDKQKPIQRHTRAGRNDFLKGVARVYRATFGERYNLPNLSTSPFRNFAHEADRLLLTDMKDTPYEQVAENSRLTKTRQGLPREMTMNDMDEILRKDKSLK